MLCICSAAGTIQHIMASSICTAMMSKLDELKDQMTDGAYLQLSNELMRLHRSNKTVDDKTMRAAQQLLDMAPPGVFTLEEIVDRMRQLQRLP